MRKSVKLGAVAVGTAACIALGASGAWAGETSVPSSAPATVTSASPDTLSADGPSTARYVGTISYYIAAARYGVIYVGTTAFYFYTNRDWPAAGSYPHGQTVTFDFRVGSDGHGEAYNVRRLTAP